MYYSDSPIKSGNEDLLNRQGFSSLLSQTLINMKISDTYTVGLFGKWGSGKTSLVNMTLQEIEKKQKELRKDEQFIIVRFEPWNFSDTNQLISQFLVRLANEFKTRKDDSLLKIGKALESYSNAFELAEGIPYVGKPMAILGKLSGGFFAQKLQGGFAEKDIMKQKEFVMNLLSKQKRKILVVIDDIDRLSDIQIRQVFQLITAVAKFPNTIYLLVFDKDVVVKALEKVQEGKGNEYLEKIIQMPIQIPQVQQSAIHNILFERLNYMLNTNNKIQFSSESWQPIFSVCVSPLVNSLRAVNRLVNSLQFKFAAIASEVDFADMVALSLLEINYPEVYEWVKDNKNFFTKEDPWNEYGLKDKPYTECLNIVSSRVKEVMQYGKSVTVMQKDVDFVVEFLSMLFPCFGGKINKPSYNHDKELMMRENKIGHPEKFDRYFALDLDAIGVKSDLITDVVYNGDSLNIRDTLVALCENGHCYELLTEIKSRIHQLPSARAKILISAFLTVDFNLDKRTEQNFLSIRTDGYALILTYELIMQIDKSERLNFLIDIIHNADGNSIANVANVINIIELSYGRCAADGVEHNYKKCVELGELLELEKSFLNKIKDLLNGEDLFNIANWDRVFYLLEYFDSVYISNYLEKSLTTKGNILKFVCSSVSKLYGTDGTGYSVSEKYSKYITKENFIEALKTELENGNFFALQKSVQYECAAFYLYFMDKVNMFGSVSQNSVDEVIGDWLEGKTDV